MSHYRLFDRELELWECVMRSQSKRQCHAQKVFDKLNYSTLTPTSMYLQVANQSVRYPIGIAENILVKIWNFFVPVDFVVLNRQEDMKTPLILGRPFLSTTNAHIDVGAGEIKFHINAKEERFAFKPRPDQCSNLEWHEKQVSRSPSSGPKVTPEEWTRTGFGGLKIPNPHREVTL